MNNFIGRLLKHKKKITQKVLSTIALSLAVTIGSITISEPLEVQAAGSFDITAAVDSNGFGSVSLDWSTYNYKDKNFKIYRSDDGGKEFHSVGLDYKSVKEVRVLNIYPTWNGGTWPVNYNISFYSAIDNKNYTLPFSASIKKWMEEPNSESLNGYGKGIIKVTCVPISTFNNNPSSVLFDGNGNYKYDVIYVGTANGNGGENFSASSIRYVENWIKSGRGFIGGHDTMTDICTQYDVNYLRTLYPYFGIYDFNGGSYGGSYYHGPNSQYTSVVIQKTGLFTTYPWYVGTVGDILTVPQTHNSQERYNRGYQWLRWNTGVSDSNVFLNTYNNCARIQTGDSDGLASPDEQKIIANLIFYCNQLVFNTYYLKDAGAQDQAKPNNPTITLTDKFNFSATDNGSTYYYYVESYDKNDTTSTGLLARSKTRPIAVTTGVKSYKYIFDNNANTVITKTTGTSITGSSLNINKRYKYLHMAAVDGAENISGTTTIEVPQEFTVNVYAGSGISSVSGGGTFDVGKSTTISAVPKTGYHFTHWDGTSKINTNNASITSDGSWTAYGDPNPYPYEIHYYFQNINGKKYTEDTNLIATVKKTSYMDHEVTVPLPTVAGYKYSSMKIASGGRLNNGKIHIINESPENVAKKNVVSVYYNWDDGNNSGSGDAAKNLALITFNTNKLNWHLDPGSNISASWKWTATSTTNSSADGFESPENTQGYFVQRLYASEGTNITSGYGAFISRTQKEIALASIADKYKGNGGGNNKTWGGDFPTVTATDCTFLGWNSKADGSGTWYSANGSGNKSGADKENTAVLILDSTNKKYGLTTTLYAIWADNATVQASITYNQGVVNTATGVAGTAGNLEPLFKKQTSQVISNTGSIVTLPWAKDVAVNIIGQDRATSNYLFYSKLIGADNSHKNQDAGTTAIYAAGLKEDSGVTNTLSNNFKRDTKANKSKSASGAYTQDQGVYHLDYELQGTYAVSIRNESREYEEAVKNDVIQGDPAYKHLNNIFKIKIDNTAPVITSWRVTQDRLENYRADNIEDAITTGLYTTFKISFSDAHNASKGVYLNQKDTSGIQGVYIRVWDKNNTSNVKVYSVPLESMTNKVLTDNEDKAIFSGMITYPINLYAEFPGASGVIYEVYVVDNAGNVTEKIGSVITDNNKPGSPKLPSDPDEGPEEPHDPDDPTPSPSPDYPSGTLTNFSIKTVIYNDKDESFNVDDYVTYKTVSNDVGAFFQTGDIGHVDVWTIGYVTSVSSDFGAGAGDTMAEEAINEIVSGRLPSKYNMGLDSVGDYRRIWNHNMAEALKPKYISYYDNNLHKMVAVYRDANAKKEFSDKSYTENEQQIYNKIIIHDGVPYAAYYTTKADVIADEVSGWQASGTKVRIPPYYQMKNPYSKSEKTHTDGTTAYKTETHVYKATAYKDGDTADTTWIYMIYDMGFDDTHYRVIHEN